MRKKVYFTLHAMMLSLLCLFCSNNRTLAADDWNLLFNGDLNTLLETPVAPDPYGVFFYDGNLYISITTTSYPHAQYNERGKLFKLKKVDGSWALDSSFVISGVTTGSMNFSSFASDGTYLYAVNRSNTVYKIDPSTMTIEGKFTTTFSQAIAIAYDEEKDAFWIADNNDSSKAQLVNREGTIISTSPLVSKVGTTSYAITGLVYDNITEGGPYLLAASGNSTYANVGIINRWKLSTGEFEFTIQDIGTAIGASGGGHYMGSIYLYSDLSAGKAVLAGIYKKTNRLFEYEFAVLAEPTAPAKADDFMVVAGENGTLKATLSWKNPSKSVNGAALSSLTSVKILRNGELIHTVSSPVIGGQSTWVDNAPLQGTIEYKIVPCNEEGDGLSSSVRAFIGPDVPSAVSNLLLAKDGLNGKLTWTAPTIGLNSGWIDASTLSYKITRLPDEVVVAENLTGTTFTDNTITEIAKYSYRIVASNNAGEGGTVTSNAVVIGNALSVPFREDFDDLNRLGLWTIINANGDNITWERSAYYGKTTTPSMKYAYHATNNGDDWLITPPLQLESNKRYAVKWAARGQSTNEEKYKVFFGTSASVEGQTVGLGEYTIQSASYSEQFSLIPAQTQSGAFHLSWYANSDANKSGMFIDDIQVVEVLAVDMEALSITGPKTLSVGAMFKHTVSIRNNGLNAASGFTVTLMDDAFNVLATKVYDGTLNINETDQIEIEWSPIREGDYEIRANVSIVGDLLLDNNTVKHNVEVKPFGVFDVTIGTASSTSNSFPLYLAYEQSVSQTLYYEEEINATGRIDSIRYYNSFSTALNDRNVRIYMAMTDAEEFAGKNWITSATLVFDGNIDFPAGNNTIPIKLDRPFHYTGGNLMVMCIAPVSENKVSGSNFSMATSNKTNRSIYRYSVGPAIFEYSSDGNSFTFQNTGLQIYPTSNFPVMSLVLNSEVGIVKGIVTDGINPLKEVLVQVEGTVYSATTNSQGEYEIRGVPVGTHTIKASKQGYGEISVSQTEISKTEDVTVDFILSSLSQVNLEGSVVDASSNPVKNASIALFGYKTYKAVTNEEGKFTIEGVYASRIYDLQVNAGGFVSVSQEVIFAEEDLLLAPIQLESCSSNSPKNLTLEKKYLGNWYDVRLTWEAPDTDTQKTLIGYNIYSNGILVNDEPVSDLTYIYVIPMQGEYTVEVAALWDTNCESTRIEKTIEVEQNPCEIAISEYPYGEGFESGLPVCWNQENEIGEEIWKVVKGEGSIATAYAGDYSIRFHSYGLMSSTKLVTPMLDLTGIVSPALTFYQLMPPMTTTSYNLRMYYKNAEDAEWVLFHEYADPVSEWEFKTLDLPNPSETYWIAFEGTSDQWSNGIYLDEVKVINDLCDPVADLAFEQVMENQGMLTWTVPSATRIVGYKVIRDGAVRIENVETNYFLDKEISVGNHAYQVIANYEKAYCTESDPVSINVTTQEMCDPIDNIRSVVTDRTTVQLTWDPTTAVKFSSYTVVRDGITLTQSLTGNTYTDTGLSEGLHKYSIYVNYTGKEICTVSAATELDVIVKCTAVDNFEIEVTLGRIARLSWEIPVEGFDEALDIASFEVSRDGVLLGTVRKNEYVDNTIEAGVSYSYSVKPIYDNGCVGESTQKSIFVDCNAPHLLEIDMVDKGETCSATLSWGTLPEVTPSLSPIQPFQETITPNPAFMYSSDQYTGNGSVSKDMGQPIFRTAQNEEEPSTNAIFDNGPFITHRGVGYGGADISTMDQGNYVRGFLVNRYGSTIVADDFELLEETLIEEMDFFVFMSPATNTESYITHLFVAIYDDDPSQGGRLVWGDPTLTTNLLYVSGFVNAYRVDPEEALFTDTTRPIMGMKASIQTVLPAGKYWVLMSSYSSIASYFELSGPWMIPVTIFEQYDTGNAVWYHGVRDSDDDEWRWDWTQMQHNMDANGNPTGAGGNVGLPFTIYGQAVSRAANIYCDGKLIASNVEGNTYVVNDVTKETHVWEVSYVCGDDESDSISVETEGCSVVGMDEVPVPQVTVYPNPVFDLLTVKKDGQIKDIQILDISGRVLLKENNINASEWHVDMSRFAKGIYLIKVDNQDVKVVKN